MPEISEVKGHIEHIRREAVDLTAYLETLSDSQRNQPSACDGWSVADLVGHLVYAVKDVCYEGVSRGLKGDISRPEGFPDPENLSKQDRAKFIFDMGGNYSGRDKGLCEQSIMKRLNDRLSLLANG